MSSKAAATFLTAILLSIAMQGQQGASPAASQGTPPEAAPSDRVNTALPVGARPVIGVALEGGGALGLAHVGVLQWMEEHHIPIDRIAGTSMGALVGSLYASGATPAEMRALATSDAFTGVFTLQSPYADASYRRRQDRREIPQSFTVGLRHGPQLRNALLAERGVSEFLLSNMAAYNTPELDFDRLPIPFRCVATDLNTLQPVTYGHGPLPQAVRASISIPGVFSPVQGNDGHFLVDGGIMDNLPTDVVRHDLHADIVIAVHLEAAPISPGDTSSIVGVLNRAFSAGIEQNVERAKLLADLVISIPLDDFSGTDYDKGGQLIRAGYLAAEQNSAALLRYALDDNDWNAYLAARKGRILPRPGALRQVHIEGGSPSADRSVLADMKPLEGRPITPAATLDALKPIQSNGGYDATYEVFTAASPGGSTALRTPGAAPDDAGILVRLTKDVIGPPYLIIGPEIADATSNISRMGLTLRVVDQNLGGFGSEFRGTAEVGYRTNLSAEYYRQLTPSGFFIEPSAGVLREPVYIWAGQKRVAERFQENLVAGVEVGRTFGNTMQVSAEWRALDTRWALRTGSGGGPYLTGTGQTGLLHINIDKASSGTISPSGYRLAASMGAFYHAVGSANAPMGQFSFSRTFSIKQENIIGLSAEADSYFRANVAQPFRFTLGGPMHLSASSFDEYRGTDIYLARSGYMRRIAALPTGLGQGLYGLLGYEAGEVWSPEEHAFLRQDGTVGLVGNTPIGLVTFGVSIGDAGHRKVFLTLGRWF
jgi:NTE family protein